MATIRCAHGDTVLHTLANDSMEIDGQAFEVEAAVSATLPVSVLLGGDVPELKLLIGDNRQNKPTASGDVMERKGEEILQKFYLELSQDQLRASRLTGKGIMPNR